MNNNNKIARIVGALFLIVFITNIIGSGYIEEIIFSPDYLSTAYLQTDLWTIGFILQLISFIGTVAIAALMFAPFKQHNINFAFGYLGFRVLEAATFTFMEFRSLSLLNLSENYMKSGAADASSFQAIGAALQDEHSATFLMGMLLFCLGAVVFYYALYKSKLVPRFLSIWGLFGALMALTMNILSQTGFSNTIVGVLLHLPIGLNELFLSVYLIVKGFKFHGPLASAQPLPTLVVNSEDR